MRLFLLIAFAVVTRARVIEDCSGIIVHGIKHEKEVLKSGLDTPYQLSIDYDTNTLFFSYSTPTDADGFKSAYINLKTNDFGIIPGINGGFASAVDSKNHIVYLGGNNGVYKYDFDSKKAFHVGGSESVWQMFFKDKLYYTEYPSEDAYTFENGVATKIPELSLINVLLLAVDKNDNYVYSNSSGLFCYKKDKMKTVSLGEYNLNGIARDFNNNLYFSTPLAIYSIDDDLETITKLTDIETVYGVAVEADNSIIYADDESIIRLKPTKARCVNTDDNKL